MLLRELFENLIVNEVSMAPKNLKKLAANINAYCGIEFELYYPGMKPSEDDEDAEPDYDHVLVDLCQLIIDNKRRDPKYGLVAASVIDGDRRVDATSSFKGKWVHAERNAKIGRAHV